MKSQQHLGDHDEQSGGGSGDHGDSHGDELMIILKSSEVIIEIVYG